MSNEEHTFQPSLRGLVRYSLFLFVFFTSLFLAISLDLWARPSLKAWLEPQSHDFMFSIILVGLMFAIVFFMAVLILLIRLKNIWFVVKEEGLLIKRGIIAKKQILLLYSEIQNIREKRTLLDRLLGLKSLEVVTTSPSSAFSGILEAMTLEDADRLKELVMSKVSAASEGRETPKITHEAEQLEQKFIENRTGIDNTQLNQIKAQLEQMFIENPYPIQAGKYTIAMLLLGTACIALLAIIDFLLAIFFGAELFVALGMALAFFLFFFFPFILLAFLFYSELSGNRYRIGADSIQIEYKFIQQNISNIRFDRVQDIILRRSILERIVGLATIKVQTGERIYQTSETNELYVKNTIRALNLEDALKLRAYLAEKIGLRGNPMQPALVQKIPLEKRKPLKKAIRSTFFATIMLFAIWLLLLFLAPVSDVSAMFFSLLPWFFLLLPFYFIIRLFYEREYLKKYFYNIASDHLIIRKGVFNITEIIVPFDKIQNVFVDQDIFDRIFSLWDLHVSTATYLSGWEAHIDGVSRENGETMKKMILEKIQESKRK